MPSRKEKLASERSAGPISTEDKIARTFAMFVVKEIQDQEQKAIALSGLGFTAIEIAEMISVGENYIYVALHRQKTGKPKAAKKTQSKKKHR